MSRPLGSLGALQQRDCIPVHWLGLPPQVATYDGVVRGSGPGRENDEEAPGMAAGVMLDRKDNDGGIVVAGYVTALLLPLVGFFVGLALVIRGRRAAHGIAAMILAMLVPVLVVAAFFAYAASSAVSATSNMPHLDAYFQCVDNAPTPSDAAGC
jgi:hypothetical protein